MTHPTKERPILFNGAMVRALLAGTKTQTRRVIKDQQVGERFSHMTEDGRAHLEWLGTPSCGTGVWDVPEYSAQVASPYGQPGDRLWVREGFSGPHHRVHYPPSLWHATDEIWYWADGNPGFGDWSPPRPSIHMPRFFSRILLEITEVRVERLRDISEVDAAAEGVERVGANFKDYEDAPFNSFTSARRSFQTLWDSINGPGAWNADSWVWAVTFRRLP